MSAANEPLLPATIEVDLDDLTVQGDNSFRIWVRFQSGEYLALDIPPETEEHKEILDTITDAVSTRLVRLSEHGVVITGLTTVPDDREESDR
jgi:hypothetical protein